MTENAAQTKQQQAPPMYSTDRGFELCLVQDTAVIANHPVPFLTINFLQHCSNPCITGIMQCQQ